MENKSILSLMAAVEGLGGRSALLQMGVSIDADESSLHAERVALIEEFKRREFDADALNTINANLAQLVAARAARIAELEATLAAGTWQPLADGEEAACTCGEETCETVAYVDKGALTLEDADWMLVSFWLGEEYAFCKRAGTVANAENGGDG